MLPSQDVQMRLAELRQKSMMNQITSEELKEALTLLRQGRTAAQVTSTKSRTATAKAKAPVNSDDLLSELGDL